MEQHIPQDEIMRTIISDMVKKNNSIVPVIGEDTIVCSFGVSLILLWSSFRTLKWLRSAFLDNPSGRSTSGRLFPKGLKKAEFEEGSKVMWRYMLLTKIGLERMTDNISVSQC